LKVIATIHAGYDFFRDGYCPTKIIGERTWFGWPAIVTLPGFVGCLYCWWLPFVPTKYQPSASINTSLFCYKTNRLQRWAGVASKIAGHFGITIVEIVCALLELRIEHGVKEEQLALAENTKGVGRIRGRMLFKAGCHSIEDVQKADPGVLSKATGLPLQTCERIVRSAKDYVPIEGPEDIED
jgi:replicative superfamily II helicase